MGTPRHVVLVASIGAGALLLAAGAARAHSEAVPAAMVGSWTRNFTPAHWQKAGIPGFPTGKWKIVIGKRGGLAVYLPGTSTVDFRSSVKTLPAGRVTVAPFPICGLAATYRWRVTRVGLVFVKVKDDCSARIVFLSGTWRKN